MKNSALTVATALLLQAAHGAGFVFGKTDYNHIEYQQDCVERASEASLSREVRNEELAVCLLQRNSISNLLLQETMSWIYTQTVPRGSVADTLRVIAVDGDYSNTQNKVLDNDGKAQARVRDILLMVAEMCDVGGGANNTPLINNIRLCTDRTTGQFQACLCANHVRPQDINVFQSCILDFSPGFEGRRLLMYLEEGPAPPPFKCRALGLLKYNAKPKKKPPPASNNKRLPQDSGDAADENCYLIYEDGDVIGSTGPAEDCDFSPDLNYYEYKSYSHYEVVDSFTATDLPGSGTTATAAPTGTPYPVITDVPSALLESSATNAAQSASQAELHKTVSSGSPSQTGGPASPTPTSKDSASRSLRNGRDGRTLRAAAAVLCLGAGAYMY